MNNPFEVQMQIYVKENIVLVHPGVCHIEAQHTDDGKKNCLIDILKYNTKEAVIQWIDYMQGITRGLIAYQARMYIDAYSGMV